MPEVVRKNSLTQWERAYKVGNPNFFCFVFNSVVEFIKWLYKGFIYTTLILMWTGEEAVCVPRLNRLMAKHHN